MEKIKRIIIFILLLAASTQSAFCEIYEVQSLKEINKVVLEILENRNAEKTLFLLPLERFLIGPTHQALARPDDSYQSIFKRIAKKIQFSKAAYLDELILTQYENKLTDNSIPSFISNIQAHGAPIIIVTSNVTGGFNNIDFLEVWTFSYLVSKKIDLTKSTFADKQILFDKHLTKIMGTYPSFYRGLLSCNSYDGKNSSQVVLSVLLGEKLKWLPDTIVAIHPEKTYLESLIKQFKQFKKDIDLVGFVYNPYNRDSSDISPEAFKQFWEELVKKLNEVTRKGVKLDQENPYAQ